MKSLLLSVVAIATIALTSFGQAPEGFKYQAVVRDAGNVILNNQAVGMRLTIQQGAIGGTAVYTETFATTTNAYGLVNLEIGTGTTTDDFTTIDWANGPYFMETAVDYLGGMAYVVMGTSQLMSVPYALHAKTAENLTGSVSGHYVGELFGGGIVFYVYYNGAHGLIASLDDLDSGSGVAWSATQSTTVPGGALDMTNGTSNTAAIVVQDATAGYAATLCNVYAGGGFSDWYLPSNRELYLLASQDVLINQILDNDGNTATNGFSQEYSAPTYGRYWSSTEYSFPTSFSNYAWSYTFGIGYSSTDTKDGTCRVRAVRAF